MYRNAMMVMMMIGGTITIRLNQGMIEAILGFETLLALIWLVTIKVLLDYAQQKPRFRGKSAKQANIKRKPAPRSRAFLDGVTMWLAIRLREAQPAQSLETDHVPRGRRWRRPGRPRQEADPKTGCAEA